MTAEEYKNLRIKKGTQQAVAKKLEVYYGTILRREAGRIEITKEMELAMNSLRDVSAEKQGKRE